MLRLRDTDPLTTNNPNSPAVVALLTSLGAIALFVILLVAGIKAVNMMLEYEYNSYDEFVNENEDADESLSEWTPRRMARAPAQVVRGRKDPFDRDAV